MADPNLQRAANESAGKEPSRVPNRKVVVVGASAGGLEGLQMLVRDLPANLDASVFVVMHLSPGAKSNLAAILGKGAALRVDAVHGAEPIESARVYVAPPDRHLVIQDHRVSASRAPRENHHRPSIDVLFRSAALAFGEDVIGIVLSGTLYDGTAGLRWIKRLGGTAIVQDPDEALFTAMPTSAINNVAIDRILHANEIAGAITEIVAEADRGRESPMSENGPIDAQGAPANENGNAPSSFVCPDCGGTLFELGADETLRFRCRVGHAFSPEGLHGEQERNLEESLWTAVRSLEEHADLARRLATWARGAGLSSAARRFEDNAAESVRKAGVVRRALTAEYKSEEPADHSM